MVVLKNIYKINWTSVIPQNIKVDLNQSFWFKFLVPLLHLYFLPEAVKNSWL